MLDAPSPLKNPGLASGGVCTRDDELDGFRVEIGAEIDGRRFTKLNGRPSSESLSPVAPPFANRNETKRNETTMINIFGYLFVDTSFLLFDTEFTHLVENTGRSFLCCIAILYAE